MEKQNNIYPDHSQIIKIEQLVVNRYFDSTHLCKQLSNGEAVLLLSMIHLVETEACNIEKTILGRIELFRSFEERNWVKWCANPWYIQRQELLHYEGTHFFPEEKRLLLPSFGHLFVYNPGQAHESSDLFKTSGEYIDEWEKNRGKIKELFKNVNDTLDIDYEKFFERNRNEYDKEKRPPNPFWNFMDQVLTSWALDDPSGDRYRFAKRVVERLQIASDEQVIAQLPMYWIFYRLETTAVEAKTRYEKGLIRDILHASYVPYVDMICVDSRTLARAKEANIPGDWLKKMISNKEFDGQWLSAST